MQKSEAINELATALAKAQAEIKGAVKDSQNPFFKSSYADLASVWEAIRLPLSKNGLSVIQTTAVHDNSWTSVETTLMHSSGQWVTGTLPVKTKDDSPQALGSGLSYARRYSLAAMVGVYQIDDDASLAQGNRPPAAQVAPQTVKRPDPGGLGAKPATGPVAAPRPGFGNQR